MRVTRYRGEKSVQELAQRLFEIEEGGGATPASVAASLAAANRHLPLKRGSLSKAMKPGTLIAVPDVEGARAGGSSSSIGEVAIGVILERVATAVEHLGRSFEADRRSSLTELDRVRALLASEAFRSAAADDKELAAKLAAVEESARARQERLDETDRVHRIAAEGAARMVDGLLRTLAHARARKGEAPDRSPDGRPSA